MQGLAKEGKVRAFLDARIQRANPKLEAKGRKEGFRSASSRSGNCCKRRPSDGAMQQQLTGCWHVARSTILDAGGEG